MAAPPPPHRVPRVLLPRPCPRRGTPQCVPAMRRGLCRLCARGPYERGLERYLQTHARSRAFAFLDQGRRNGAILECLRDAIVAQCGPALWPRVLRALRCHRTQDLEELLQGPARFHDTIAALVAQERGRTEGRARATSPAPPPALAPRLAAVWAAVQPREAYVRERDELRAAVERKLAPLARGAPPRVYLFGSAAMGLCLADADVDLACDAVEGPQWRGVHAQDRRREQRAFLREALATLGEYGPLAVVKDARVPVLRKFGAPQGGALNWDLSCRMIGVANAQVIRQYVDAYPVVRPLCVLLKDWAKVTKVCVGRRRRVGVVVGARATANRCQFQFREVFDSGPAVCGEPTAGGSGHGRD